ncbi:uncharacterized protein DUF3761 [Pseudonocardia autotrophica]|uniref:DUF3761 domain-containing protein n=1 Tax=Pseudonocardia autotrophica TaxID=2074 RepID=A0A1Y2MTC1_PSEAH|nr:hypothetical protein BG845_04589 [Pseudonocardia autotrophica]TDN75742.1 uncharacterized protein DUF3761 [Pseudonocardia autotrophica]
MNGHLHSGWHDDSPTERLPVVGTRAKRNRLATTGIVLVLLAAVSTPFSATAPFGVLFAFAALFCAAIAVWRSREGRVPNRGRAMTALIAAPVLLVLAVAMTPPVDRAASERTAAATAEATEARAIAAVEQERAEQERIEQARVEQERVERERVEQEQAEQARVAEQQRVEQERAEQARVAERERVEQEQQARARADQQAPLRAAPAPQAPPQRPAPAAAPSCNSSSHYINSDGNCVQRPTQASSAPPGATAKCKNGSYSFSQNRSGTCSRNGGVAQWL